MPANGSKNWRRELFQRVCKQIAASRTAILGLAGAVEQIDVYSSLSEVAISL